jgi:hypothetical protein
MLPFIVIIVIAILTFRSARTYGRSGVLWTLAVVVGYFAIQFGVSIAVFIFLVVGAQIWNWSPSLYDDHLFIIGLIALVPSVVYAIIILKLAGRVREDYVPVVKKSEISIFDGDE